MIFIDDERYNLHSIDFQEQINTHMVVRVVIDGEFDSYSGRVHKIEHFGFVAEACIEEIRWNGAPSTFTAIHPLRSEIIFRVIEEKRMAAYFGGNILVL
jgi:hypothetical protein